MWSWLQPTFLFFGTVLLVTLFWIYPHEEQRIKRWLLYGQALARDTRYTWTEKLAEVARVLAAVTLRMFDFVFGVGVGWRFALGSLFVTQLGATVAFAFALCQLPALRESHKAALWVMAVLSLLLLGRLFKRTKWLLVPYLVCVLFICTVGVSSGSLQVALAFPGGYLLGLVTDLLVVSVNRMILRRSAMTTKYQSIATLACMIVGPLGAALGTWALGRELRFQWGLAFIPFAVAINVLLSLVFIGLVFVFVLTWLFWFVWSRTLGGIHLRVTRKHLTWLGAAMVLVSVVTYPVEFILAHFGLDQGKSIFSQPPSNPGTISSTAAPAGAGDKSSQPIELGGPQ
jgi:hypothetical protein